MIKLNMLRPKHHGCFFYERIIIPGNKPIVIPAFYTGKNKWGLDEIKYKRGSWPRIYTETKYIIDQTELKQTSGPMTQSWE